MDSKCKNEMCLGANLDMISNLPNNVIDEILVRLPIIEAVRTSVLSRNWRYKWTTIPHLVFDNYYALISPHYNEDKLINFIDRVLLLHSGFIHKFELSTRCLLNTSRIDDWILFLSRKNIKEFVLMTIPMGGGRYKLPTCFFSAQKISTLELRHCVLKPPPTFTGFSNLKSLYLWETKFDNGGFECLISNCPVLERLTWVMLDWVNHLRICSSNLKYLYLCGTFDDICFETPLLSDLSIDLTDCMSDEIIEKFHPIETRNVFKILNSLPSLRKFVVDQYFIEFLGVGEIPEKLPFTCHHLNNLSLQLNFEYVNGICVTLCLLNSFPNLRELDISSCSLGNLDPDIDIGNFWEERMLIDWNMSGLQIVKITFITGYESELEFIKLLLANSPMLEMLTIRSGMRDRLEFWKELLLFPRASPKVRIKFNNEECGCIELKWMIG